MILSDRDIVGYVNIHNLIDPFVGENVKVDGLLSYGLQPAGYDLRLGSKFKYANPYALRDSEPSNVLYPWAIDPSTYQFYEMDEVLLRPGDSLLAETFETINMPLDLSASIQGKSSLARCFITLNTTVADPGFHGKLTLEITNLGKMSVALRAGMGIGQIQFFKLMSTASIGYGDKGGIYQGQTQVEESKWRAADTVVCKGCYALGTACRKCTRCKAEIERLINAAITANEDSDVSRLQVEIIYRNYKGETSTRLISPWGLESGPSKWHPNAALILKAYDHGKAANRDFDVSEIYRWYQIATKQSP